MSKKAILCVDDEVIILMSLTQELKTSFADTFIYEAATSAEEAFHIIDELATKDVNVIFIITDWLMPGMKGDEFIGKVSAQHPNIKTIMITGQADEEAIERVKATTSVMAVFQKPWDHEKLIQVISENI